MGWGGTPPAPVWPSGPVATPTYDGSGRAVHPSVVYVPAGWNGWKFWMGMTPFPNGDKLYENPSILVSNDGRAWQVPTGLTNPAIAERTDGGNYADVHLLLDGGTLYMYYNLLEPTDTETGMWVTTSTDGLIWTAPQRIIAAGDYEHILSPAVVKEPGGYAMYVVDNTVTPYLLRRRTATGPTGPWSAPETVPITIPGGWRPWHIDVQRIEGRYLMHLCDNQNPRRGWLASSVDGLDWQVAPSSQDASSWATSVYRCAIQRIAHGVYGLWVGGVAPGNIWRIGYVTIPASAFP